MKYAEFRDKVKNYPVFRSHIVDQLSSNPATLRVQLTHWIKQGLIVPLKRSLYTLRGDDRNVMFSRYFLANQLYTPSYISLETALSYYNIIPEKVTIITSVSSKKTQEFKNAYGSFTYQHIKTAYYGNYVSQHDEFGYPYLMASKEKALIDFLYLKMRHLKTIGEDVFEQSFRFQNLEPIDITTLEKIASTFEQKKLHSLTELLITHIRSHYA